jgi:sugar phosphate isomerase/epimerase
VHNHGGKHWLGSSEALSYLFGRSSPRIGLCLDTAWCFDSGEDPLQWTEKFADRLVTVHLKDFVYTRSASTRTWSSAAGTWIWAPWTQP